MTEPFIDRGFLNSAVADPLGTARSVPDGLAHEQAIKDLQYELRRIRGQEAKIKECLNLLWER